MKLVEVNIGEIRDKFAKENDGLYNLMADAIEEDQEMELVCTVLYDIMLQRKHKEIQDEQEMKEVMKVLEHASEPLTAGVISSSAGLPEEDVRKILSNLIESDEIVRDRECYRV